MNATQISQIRQRAGRTRARRGGTKVGPALKLSEADVQTSVVQFLELDGWRAIRTDPVSDRGRGKGFGEVGMPDYLFIRYGAHLTHGFVGVGPRESLCEVLWIEFKAPGKTPKPHQEKWHAAERARGALVLAVDEIRSFHEWYSGSGLARRVR